jgi:hypothetical protein
MPKFVQYLYLIPLALSAVISLKAFRLSWPRAFQLFAIFLIGTLLIELFAVNWKLWMYETTWWKYTKSNTWIYNLYYLPNYFFYYIFYYKVLEPGVIKKSFVQAVCFLFLTGSVINLFFIQGFIQLDTYTVIAGNLGVLFFSLHYFKQELQKKQPGNVSYDPLFWISLGAFIFHTASLPYFVFFNYLNRTNLHLSVVLIRILLVLNFFMQTSYLIAFLCCSPFQKKPI